MNQQTPLPPTPPETLPADWYHGDEHFARERQAIFWTNWMLIGREDQLVRPGDYVSDDIAGWPVFVIRSKDGDLRGFHNVCRHRAGPLVGEGPGRCSMLRCRYHGWVYDTEGTLHKAPGLNLGSDIEPAEFSLHAVRVETWNGLVFVCLDPDGPDLTSWLGDIVEIAKDFPAIPDMAFSGDFAHEGRANWKNYSDNSCEGYHVGFVHKGLGATVSDEKIDIRPYENGRFVGFDVTYEASAIDPTRHGRGFWIYKFPCLLLHFGEYSFNCERVKPLGSSSVHLSRWFWVDGEKAQALGIDPKEAIASSRLVMEEDLGICEAVQRNLEAGIYQTGRMAPTEEVGTIYFQRLVREALDGAD
ncbi:MAG: aromatic ring-hydroxylating dioxygenase subunit alpha [Gammaproteobacteria bacterium]|nr:aromatic ring-hydroxylating dioxygenase subunit alpha [Gammaproteobacteria bacterium]